MKSVIIFLVTNIYHLACMLGTVLGSRSTTPIRINTKGVLDASELDFILQIFKSLMQSIHMSSV